MDVINTVTNFLNGIIWSNPMTYLCLLGGIFFTIVLRGVQFLSLIHI